MRSTLTILFTDAVASTEELARLGDERFEVVQDGHLDLLRRAARVHEGREVKSLGDGLMVAFTGAADALASAVAMQQAVEACERRGDDGLRLRVGVSSGDVTVDEDGDVHGTAVVEAARLCAAASAGQILASELARGLAGSRGGHVFTALGPVELKGLVEPVAVVEVGWAPLAAGDALAPVPLPPRLAFESSWRFVGRAGELERLDGLWREAVEGALRVALLAGEPGAGKTRLAREVAVSAHGEGALVLFGRVDEDLVVAYQPFAEALRHYLANVDEATRELVLSLRGGVLARLVPELVDELPAGQVEAWAIFEGLVDWLAGEAAHRPIVLVVDDVHWAARPTLGALMHLARSERLRGILIVGTYRDTELDRKHPLAQALADLRREEGVERLNIRGLDTDGVEAFVQAARGDTLDEGGRELAATLAEQTQGNPFFVGQVLRHLAESGAVEQVDGSWVRTAVADSFVVPEGVREVVGRRISRLSPQAGELLTVAAVAGPEFDTAIVAQVAGQPIAEALDGFDEAVGSRLVLETAAPGRLRFAHAIVRQTLEDELTTLRRVHMHRDIAHAIEQRTGGESAVAELAHHFAESAVAGEGARAAHYAELAAVEALERGASDQAVELLERALELLPEDADSRGLRREHLYKQLAYCLWVVSDQERLETLCREWLALGRELGDDVMLVDAAGWLSFAFMVRSVPEQEDMAVFAEALRVDPWSLDLSGRRRFSLRRNWHALDPPALRAYLLGALAFAWTYGMPLDVIGSDLPANTPLALADEALRLAGESADPEVVDDMRFSRVTTLLTAPDADELLRESEYTVRRGYRFGGGGWVQEGVALARLGRLNELRALTDDMLQAAERSGDRILWFYAFAQQALEALLRGHFDEAQIATEQALRAGRDPAIFQVPYATLNVARLLASGAPDEARPVAELLNSSPLLDSTHLVGVVAAEQGDLDTARAVIESWHSRENQLPVDATLPGQLWGLARCAHAVGDRRAASHLYDHLIPYDGQLLVYDDAFVPGSTAFTLGQLAETLGDLNRARKHHSDALKFEELIGATTLAARTRRALGRIG